MIRAVPTPSSRRRGCRRLAAALAAVAAAVAFGVAASPASAATLTTISCGDRESTDFTCARLTVPIDRTGAVPGTISLYVERDAPGYGERRRTDVALVPLLAGPGQAATDFTSDFGLDLTKDGEPTSKELPPTVAFDQRGTGRSGPLTCPTLDRVRSSVAYADAAGACAQSIGASVHHYTTRDTVADLEDLRLALGVDQLALWGDGYGSKVALAYAAAYPQNVKWLVLLSVVDPAETNLFNLASGRAVDRVLTARCAGGVCRGVTTTPAADVAALVAQLRSTPLPGTAITPAGRRVTTALTVADLYTLLLDDGTYDYGALPDQLPSGVVAARRGDAAPLLRLLLRGRYDRSSPSAARAPNTLASPEGAVSSAAYLATLCEEVALPWDRTTPVGEPRRTSAAAVAAALGPAAFAPFDATQALEDPLLGGCSGWPSAAEAPTLATGSVGAVPTLVLAEEDDLRTPLEQARAVIARSLPNATMVSGGCGTLEAFFLGRPILSCPAERGSPVAPVPPRSFAQLPVPEGLTGKIGRTLTAFSLTFADAIRLSREGASEGGLRGGRFVKSGRGLSLIDDEYVPGVRVSGLAPDRYGSARFTISGPAAAPGNITLTQGGTLSGTIGGRRLRRTFRLPPPTRFGTYIPRPRGVVVTVP